jgi:hypothetical protein
MPTTAPQLNQTQKSLITWAAPARPFKERTREFYTTILSIAFLLTLILFLLKEFLLIGVIMAFAFLSYVLSTHKPDDVTHELTSEGIVSDGKLYSWETFTNYWIEKKFDQEVIMVKTKTTIPGLILMVIDQKKKKQITQILEKYLPQEKPADNFVSRASSWLSDKVPLENT